MALKLRTSALPRFGSSTMDTDDPAHDVRPVVASPAPHGVRSGPPEAQRTLDRALVLASSILLPLGLVSIVLAWYGASRTPFLFEQVPYLISGGLLGLALVVGAGFCYVGSWVTRSARDQRAANAQLTSLLEQIRDELADAADAAFLTAEAAAVTAAAQPQPTGRRVVPRPGSAKVGGAVANGHGGDAPRLVATASGSMLHRPDCAVVVSRPDVREVSEDAPGLAPCRLCDPLATVDV
jgi:hypothetical protein